MGWRGVGDASGRSCSSSGIILFCLFFFNIFSKDYICNLCFWATDLSPFENIFLTCVSKRITRWYKSFINFLITNNVKSEFSFCNWWKLTTQSPCHLLWNIWLKENLGICRIALLELQNRIIGVDFYIFILLFLFDSVLRIMLMDRVDSLHGAYSLIRFWFSRLKSSAWSKTMGVKKSVKSCHLEQNLL